MKTCVTVSASAAIMARARRFLAGIAIKYMRGGPSGAPSGAEREGSCVVTSLPYTRRQTMKGPRA